MGRTVLWWHCVQELEATSEAVRAGAHRGAQFTCFTSTQVQIRTPVVRRAQELTQVSEAASRRYMDVVYSSMCSKNKYTLTHSLSLSHTHTHTFRTKLSFHFGGRITLFHCSIPVQGVCVCVCVCIYIVVVCVVTIYTCAQELTHVSEAASRCMDVVIVEVVVVVCVVTIYTCAQELTHVSQAASRYMDVVTTSAPEVPAERGTQFTCFTGTKVYLLTESL